MKYIVAYKGRNIFGRDRFTSKAAARRDLNYAISGAAQLGKYSHIKKYLKTKIKRVRK